MSRFCDCAILRAPILRRFRVVSGYWRAVGGVEALIALAKEIGQQCMKGQGLAASPGSAAPQNHEADKEACRVDDVCR